MEKQKLVKNSKTTYEKAVESNLLSEKGLEVYKLVFDHPRLTQNEYHSVGCRELARDINKPSFTPLFSRLVAAGWIKPVDDRACTISGKICLLYEVTGKVGTKINRPKPKISRADLENRILELEEEIKELRNEKTETLPI